MHFSYVEIGDNFVPDYNTDPFRRIPVKYGVVLSDEEKIEDAEEMIKTRIKEYIQKNTVVSHEHIQEYYVSPTALPIIQRDFTTSYDEPQNPVIKEPTPEEQIMACATPEELEKSFALFIKTNPKYQLEYDKRMYILTH